MMFSIKKHSKVDMVIGFGDRGAYQTGHINVAPDGDTGTLSNGTSVYYSGHVGGDILRAFSDGNGTYVIENAAKAGPSTGYEPTNNQGPGFGEFYNDDFIIGGFLAHSENSNGGLALRPGSGEMIYSAMEP